MRLKAGALQLVLFVGVLVCLLLMAFILLISTQNNFKAKQSALVDLIKKGQSTTNPQTSKAWGVFELKGQQNSFKNLKWDRHFLSGTEAEHHTALYLQDKGFPVVLAGTAKIYGDAFLPERGIKRGNIRGHSYQGDYLVHGQENTSSQTLPSLSPELKAQLSTLVNSEPSGKRFYSVPDQLSISFEEQQAVILGDLIRLDQQKLNGKILIKASRKIIVEQGADLWGVILFAPEIEIKKGVFGAFQAYASHQITMGKGVELAYPSVLGVYDQSMNIEGEIPPVKVSIDSGSNIRGGLLYLDDTPAKQVNHHPDILIAKNAIIDGQVYCQGSLDLQGTVNGVVYTSLFQTFQNGSNYVNHLFNGQINRSALPQEFAGISIGNNKQKALVQWVD